jgi:hypothetical protein
MTLSDRATDKTLIRKCELCGETVIVFAACLYMEPDEKGEAVRAHTCKHLKGGGSVYAISGGAWDSNRRKH